MRISLAASAAFLLILAVVAGGCIGGEAQWSITVNGDGTHTINSSQYTEIACSNITVSRVNGVPLEQFLYRFGVYPVTSVTIGGHTYEWASLASTNVEEIPVIVLPDGRIFDGKSYARVDNINVTTTDRPAHSSLEIEPSMLYALGLGDNGSLIQDKSGRIVLFYVDAMGFERYEQAKSKGLINNITSLGEPVTLTCMYPSISIVNSKTLVSGLPPDATRGNFESYTPDGPTILEAAAQHNLSAYWIDGQTQPVSLGKYTTNRPDLNDNGYEADEVTTEAIRRYDNGTNLLYVHYKDTDTIAHNHGPYSDEAMNALQFADAQIGRMLPVLDPGTMVIVYSDHGGHTFFEWGNHGTLIPSDMVVPFIVHVI